MALLGISRLLPETGFGLWVRLAAATLVVLLPGMLVARCLGQRSAAATLATSVTLVGAGLALTFALGASLDVTLAFVLPAGAVALVWSLLGRGLEGVRLPGEARFARGAVGLAGVGLGVGIWFVQGAFTGDVFFHLGRIRKLEALHSLSLHNVGEFRHAGLHPGYAFPMWHAWLALVARLAGVDPTSVAAHEASILVPVALVLVFEMGWAIFRSVGLAVAVVLAQLAFKVFAPGHGGVYRFLWEPGSVATQLLVPAAVAFFFYFVRKPTWPTGVMLAATSGSLALVHPTYALFVAIPLGAFVIARALLTWGRDFRSGVLAFAVFGLPMALAFLWLEPVVQQTIPVSPGPAQLAQNLHHYRSDLVVHSLARYSLAPNRIDRNGAVTIVALLMVPACAPRPATALGRIRARRDGRRARGRALAARLPALLQPGLALAVAALVGVHPVLGGPRRRRRDRRPLLADARARGRAGGGHLAPGRVRGDFGLRASRTAPAIVVWIALYGASRR